MSSSTSVMDRENEALKNRHDQKQPDYGTDETSSQEESVDDTAQDGVRIAEAMTLSWSRKSLYIVYGWAMTGSFESNLIPYVTSSFESHSLMPVIDVIASVMSAATYMPMAKILNLWDRTVGFVCMVIIATVGMIMMASCQNVQQYAAANVFYNIGFTGMIFSVDIVTADTSSLKMRAFAYAFTSSPYIITAFGGSKAADTIHADDNWRWGFGAWAIVLPVVAVPMVVMMQLGKRQAKQNGFLAKPSTGRTWMQSLRYYAVEFDVIGVFLLSAGFVLFLLPFTLAASSQDQWRSTHIIVMLVVGFVTLIAFGLWERFGATTPFVPWAMLNSRTVIGACLLSATYQVAYYCWASYLTSYLQVVYNVSVAHAGYISSIFDVVSGVELFIVGILIRWTGRYKWVLMWGVPLYILGVGLMIYFRMPNKGLGYIIMCQIFTSLGGGVIVGGQQVAIAATVSHDKIASAMAILSLFGTIGGAIGNSISGGIWTNTLPAKLQHDLPDNLKDSWQAIYDDLEKQLSYPWGSEARNGIISAYAGTQRLMLVTGTCIMCLGLGWMMMLKNVNLKKTDQVKGVVL